MPVSQEIEKREQRLQEALKAYRSGLPELEDELHKQRGGKHDRRVLTKARLATAEYLTARKEARDQEKENKAVTKSTSKGKKSDRSNSIGIDPEPRQSLEPFQNCLHTFQLNCSSSGGPSSLP
ncbi:hypothetical protein L211DRAFT_870707 [Terfezia boudieri ATCC MYA-4762]|uniref:Uncharacterized protein n=1 Tax=Terfezia boudieri ATCC MYA-4762 TaxID=1051890 RepID=A0A3N4LBV3_9PEZI|nr:hypothetical protein L211DRAFT_870707 [Terfezia boudieri ATCC MYA-4762]